jgi:hypothetical protein
VNKIVIRVLFAIGAVAAIYLITRAFWSVPYELLGILLGAVALAGGIASLRWRVFVALVIVALGVFSIRAFYASKGKEGVFLAQLEKDFQRREAERDKRFDQKLDAMTEGFQQGVRIASLPTAKQIAQAYHREVMKVRASELSEQIRDFLSDWTTSERARKSFAIAMPPGSSDDFSAVYTDRFAGRVTKMIEELKDIDVQDAKLETLARRQDQDASSARDISDRLSRLAGSIRD